LSPVLRKPRAAVASDAELTRARMLEVLSRYLDEGITVVSVREMLDLLDPRYTPPAQDKPDPRADPLTGCLPVTWDGKPPPR